MFGIIIGTIAILICIIASVINKDYDNRILKIFPYYLLFTAFVQIIAYEYSHILKKSNHFIFNIDLLVDTCFWIIFYVSVYRSKKLKNIAIAIGFVFLAYAIFNLCHEGFWVYNNLNDTISSVIITAYCLLYLGELFISDEFMNYFSIPVFWISAGLLFFNAGEIVYFGLFNYIDSHKLDPQGKIYASIMITLNLLMYGFFTIGCFAKKLWQKNR